MPVADSFRYMAEPIQYCKVKKKEKATIKKKEQRRSKYNRDHKQQKRSIKSFL